jgi:hypothetical protein
VVDGYDVNNLTKLLIQNLMARGGLIEEALFFELLCFGVNLVIVFQVANWNDLVDL